MEYPVFVDHLDDGGLLTTDTPFAGKWTSKSDTDGKIAVEHYTRLAERGRRGKEPPLPYTGQFALRVDLDRVSDNSSNDAYVAQTGLADITTSDDAYISFMLYVSSEIYAQNDDEFDIVGLWDGSAYDLRITLKYGEDADYMGWKIGMSTDGSAADANTAEFPVDEFVHVAFFIDASADTVEMFLDGEPVATPLSSAAVGTITETRVGALNVNSTVKHGFMIFDRFEEYATERPRPFDVDPVETERYLVLAGKDQTEHKEGVFVGPGRVVGVTVAGDTTNEVYVDLFDTDRAQDRAGRHVIRIHAPAGTTAYLDSNTRYLDFEDGCYAVITKGAGGAEASVWIDIKEKLGDFEAEFGDDDDKTFTYREAVAKHAFDVDLFNPDED